jgi:hypothetical protein
MGQLVATVVGPNPRLSVCVRCPDGALSSVMAGSPDSAGPRSPGFSPLAGLAIVWQWSPWTAGLACRRRASIASLGGWAEKVNQHSPFAFRGAADDEAVYAALKALTSP